MMAPDKPLVSIVLAVRNEAAHIKSVLASLQAQESPEFDMEILVIDGASTDGSGDIARRLAAQDPHIRVLTNAMENTPAAFNLGISAARGDYICICGAHTTYDPAYISVCLSTLIERSAAGCSGQLITKPANNTIAARLIAWTQSHPFGSSGRSMRTAKAGFIDTIPYPLFKRAALLDVGGYDPDLHRNQDNDISQKLRAQGHTLFLTDQAHCHYFAKSTIGEMAKSAFHNGYWNIISWRKNAAAMALRHFVPLFFVVALVVTCLLALVSFLAPADERLWLIAPPLCLLGLHLLAGEVAGIQIGLQNKSTAALLSPFVFLVYHFSYGLGSAWAVLRNAQVPSRLGSASKAPFGLPR